MKAGPTVLTGSHNWTTEAETYNDENTIIIHDSTVANLFYQAFHREYYSLGGTLTQHCVPLGIDEVQDNDRINLYPVPANNYLMLEMNLPTTDFLYTVYNVMGQEVISGKLTSEYTNSINVSSLPSGIYLLTLRNNEKQFTQKFVKE
jgi:hypothetical protein